MSAHDRNRRGYANPTSHQDLVVKVRGSVVGTGKGALDPDGTDRVTLQGLADCIGPVSDILEVDLALRWICGILEQGEGVPLPFVNPREAHIAVSSVVDAFFEAL